MPRRTGALRRLAREERGVTLVELLVVVALLGIVLGAVTSLYLSGVRTQANLSAQFEAQDSLHVAMDRMRLDVHLACSETAVSAASVSLDEPPCDGSAPVTWCTRASGATYSLYRVSGTSCSGGADLGDYLVSGAIFSYQGPNVPAGSNALPRLHVDATVDADPDAPGSFHVVDDLVLRNGARA